MRTSIITFVFSVTLVGCGTATHEFGTDGGGGQTALDGLPCEVADLLAARCVSCHGNPPTNAAPMPLTSYEDLVAPSRSAPSRSVAAVSIDRMRDSAAPMPPGATTPPDAMFADEIAAFDAWVNSGMPRGECSSPGTEPVVCTSDEDWVWGDEPPNENRRPEMNPGMACNACHRSEREGPIFQIAGTVYPTYHEPDLCLGQVGVTVEVTDAAGHTVVMTTNASGNFSYEGDALALPISAKVTNGDASVTMTKPVDTGDCNSCHTQDGNNGAPGRIRAP